MRNIASFLIYATSVILSLAGVLAAQEELKTVPKVDLNRYVGKWYEIAKYPNRFEKSCQGNVTAEYALRPDGRIDVKNSCLKKDGKMLIANGEAKIADKSTNAKLKVRFAPKFLSFLPFVWGDYWVIDLDKDYKYVAIGDKPRAYFWILSREPTMDEKTYQAIVSRVEKLGFKPEKIERTRQNISVS